MSEKINGVSLGALGAGILFLYSGVRGKSITAAITGLVRGKNPGNLPSSTLQAPVTSSSTAPGGTLPGFQPSGLPSAGRYSQAQLMQLWQAAGGSASSASNAACHGMQESSGDPLATSPNGPGCTNVGLWQLATPCGVGAGHTVQELQNAMNNAILTVQATRDGADWSQWATPGC